MLLVVSVVHLLAAGFQVSDRAILRRRPSASPRSSPRCSPAPCRCRRRASARIRRSDADEESLYLAFGRHAAALDRRLHRAGRRRVLDPRDSVLRRHQAAARPRQRQRPAPPPLIAALPDDYRAAVSAARHHDDARSAVQHRVSLRRGVPGRSAIPRGAGRPDLAIALLEKGLRARPDKWEYMQDIGFVHYWYRPRLPARPPTGSSRPARCPARRGGCGRWRRRRSRRAATGGRRARCGRRFVQSAEIDWLRQDAERRLLAAARARRDRRAAAASSTTYSRRDRPAAAHWPALVRARVAARRARSIPTGTPYELTRRPRAAVASRRRSGRCRSNPSTLDAAASMIDDAAAGVPDRRRRRVRRDRRQLSERLHLPPAARQVDRVAGVGLPALRPRAVVVREHSGRSATSCSRGRCRTCARADQRPLSDRRSADRRDVRVCVVVLRPAAAAGLAAGLRLRADRAVRHRSRAPPAAERRSRCPASSSASSFSFFTRARMDGVAHRHRWSAAACCVAIAEAYYRDPARGRARAWATSRCWR